MNYLRDEYTAEYNRQRIVEEIQQIRLEEKALRTRDPKPHPIFLMLSLGMQWINRVIQILTSKPEEREHLINEALESSNGLSLEK